MSQMTTSDTENYEVHCGNCNWWGQKSQLVAYHIPNPLEKGDVISEPCCPWCASNLYLEYEEDSISSASSLEIALANLEQADKHFGESMENLRCLILQLQN